MSRTNRGAAPAPPTAGITEAGFQELFRRMFDRMFPDADRSAAFLSMSLNRLATLIRQHLASIDRSFGRSMTSIHVLTALEALGPTTPTEIARLTRVTAPSVSSVLRGLRKDRLVEVVGADADGDARMKIVRVLPAGRQLLHEVMSAAHESEVQWASVLGESERAALIDQLLAMAAEIERMPPPGESEPDQQI